MVIDTSALVAMALDEPEADAFRREVVEDAVRLISAATVLEAAIVLEARRGELGGESLDRWLYKAKVEIVPFDADQADLARGAWRRYGKGRHRAALNYGDCISYALAKARNEPLLFKGDDFAQTDIARVTG